MKTSQNGDVVIAHYIGTLDDGTVFDKTQEKEPVGFIVGADTILPDINRAFIGMSEGEEKQITIAPEDAFGMWEEANVKKFSRLCIDEMEPRMMKNVVSLLGDHVRNAQKSTIDPPSESNRNPASAVSAYLDTLG